MYAFSVKKQAQDRPMSMWISSIKQLEPVRHLLNPLLLDFMEAAWPSSISMVIPRGRCLRFRMTSRNFMFVHLVSNRAVDGHLWSGGCCQTHRDSTKHCHQEPRLLSGHIPDWSGEAVAVHNSEESRDGLTIIITSNVNE